jgi:hypothetical protein
MNSKRTVFVVLGGTAGIVAFDHPIVHVSNAERFGPYLSAGGQLGFNHNRSVPSMSAGDQNGIYKCTQNSLPVRKVGKASEIDGGTVIG